VILKFGDAAIGQLITNTEFFSLSCNSFGIGFHQQFSNIGICEDGMISLQLKNSPPGQHIFFDAVKKISISACTLSEAPLPQQLDAKRKVSAAFFRQRIAFLNQWTMDPEVREFLVAGYGADGLPFNTCFGGGEPIEPYVVNVINEVYEASTAREPWQVGDLLMVDNIRTAHAREPFEGPREIMVAMSDPVRAGDPRSNGQ